MAFYQNVVDWLRSGETVSLAMIQHPPNRASTLKLFETCAEVQKMLSVRHVFAFALSSRFDTTAIQEVISSGVRVGPLAGLKLSAPILMSHRDLYVSVALFRSNLPRELILVVEHDDQCGVEYAVSMMHAYHHAGIQRREDDGHIRIAIFGLPNSTTTPIVQIASKFTGLALKIFSLPVPTRTTLRMPIVRMQLRYVLEKAAEANADKIRAADKGKAIATTSSPAGPINDGVLVFTARGATTQELGLGPNALDQFRVYHIGPLSSYSEVKRGLMDEALKLVVASPEMRFLRSTMRGIGHVMWLDGCKHRRMVRDGNCGQILLHQMPANVQQLRTTSEYAAMAVDRAPGGVQVVIPQLDGLKEPPLAVAGRDFLHFVFELMDNWPDFSAQELAMPFQLGPSETSHGVMLMSHMGAFVGGELGHAVRRWTPTYPQHPLSTRVALGWLQNDWAAAYFLSHVGASQPSLPCMYAAAQLATLMSLGLGEAVSVVPQDGAEAVPELNRRAVLEACVGPLAGWAPDGALWMLHGLWLYATRRQLPTADVIVRDEPLVVSSSFCKAATRRYQQLEGRLNLPVLRSPHDAPVPSEADRLTIEMALLAVSLHRVAVVVSPMKVHDLVSQKRVELDPLSRLLNIPADGCIAVYDLMWTKLEKDQASGDFVIDYGVDTLTCLQSRTLRRWHAQPWLALSPLHSIVPWSGHQWCNSFAEVLDQGLDEEDEAEVEGSDDSNLEPEDRPGQQHGRGRGR